MSYENNVIRYLRRKGDFDFEPVTWIGSEQRFVGPLRNSNINNLEEQYILGTDTYTEFYEDNSGNSVIEKSFCITNDNLDNIINYYKMISVIYKNPIFKNDISFIDGEMQMTNKYNDIVFGDGSSEYPDVNSIYYLDADKYKFDQDGNLQLTSSSNAEFAILREDKLYFIKENEQILVLTKITEGKSEDGKTVIREKIINSLNPS